MKLPNAVQASRPWRIHPIVSDFTLEDVWALPVGGRPDEFPALLALMTGGRTPSDPLSLPARSLWKARDLLGRLFDLGRISASADGSDGAPLPIPGTTETSLRDRLPDDLRGTADDLVFPSLPFTSLYRTDREFAAELSNATVHAVMHLAWVEGDDGRCTGQMAVYVRPRGTLGSAYMAFIKPFRLGIVYPSLMRRIEHQWQSRDVRPTGRAGAAAVTTGTVR